MKNIFLSLSLLFLFAISAFAQSPNTIRQRCPSPNGSVYGIVSITGAGNIVYTPCPTKTSIFTGNVDFSGATVIGGAGTFTSLTVTPGNISVPLGMVTTATGYRASSSMFLDTTSTGDVAIRPGFQTTLFIQNSTLFTGIGGTVTPRKRLDVLDASSSQLRLTQADNSVYTDLQTTGAGFLNIQPTGGIVQINGTAISKTIASGTAVLGTGAITSATCATVVTASATGVATTDVISLGFNGDPTAVTGYIPSTSGMLTIITYPTANNVNIKVCNNTSGSITPGAVTLNWRVTR